MSRGAPASLAQHGVWFTEQVGGAGSAYHVPLAIRLDGELDVRALAGACEAVVSRHPVLGSAFEERDGVLHVVPAAVRPHVERQDLSTAPAGEVEALLDGLVRREVRRPFDLRRGPLARFTLWTLAPARSLLLAVVHHAVFDGESKDVLAHDLAVHYGALARGEAAGRPLPLAHAGHVAEERRRVAAVQAGAGELWSRRWEEPGDLLLPGMSGPSRPDRRGAAGESVQLVVDDELARGVADVARALGATRYEVLLTALQALLHRYGNERAVVAIDLATRTPETRECVGLFVNELPLASRPSSTATFRELLDATRADLRELYPYREVPLARAVPGIRPRLALAGVSMSYRRRSAAPRFAGLETSIDWMVFNGAARSALHLQVVDGPDALAASLQYSPDAIDAGGAARIAGHLLALLRGAVADPASRVAALPLLPREERERLIGEWNVTATGPRGPATVPRLFEAQVARSPGATAVVAGDARMTYAELHAAANRLAHRLRGAGVRPGTLVAVGVERSLELVVALLAVLEAGGAYLPLDPGHPAARLALVLADAGAPLVLTQRRLADRFAGSAAEVLALDDGGRLDGVPATDPAPPAGPGDLAYVIYTSGSTGRPKGVEIEHRSLANVVGAFRDALGAGSRDVWLAATSPSFDISALELFLPIVSGGRLVVAGESDVRDGAALVRLVREHAVTHVQATPSGWRLLLEAGFDERGVVALCGGEPLPVPLARDLRGRVARILNVYGPTETTVWSTLAEVAPDAGEVTIGRPIASTRVYLLDGRLELVPSGLPGELCIGGAGLARGYRRRPGLTAERFVPDPHGPPGARLYRTGDRARHRPDGRLEFLGRTDHQVKIRGHRVELGEIEAVLLGHPRVGQAAVALRPDPAGGQRLVAYLVLAGGGPATAEIRQHLGRALPEAMVPASFVTLEALPLTPNGKLDRAALPEPPAREAAAAPAASVVGLAKDVGDICREVMRIDDIQPDESLFDLGGHSLTMTMIASRIRKRLRKELPLHVFYDAPTIAGIVEALTQVESGR